MDKKQLRWALSGTLVLIFALSLVANSAIFSSGESSVAQTYAGVQNGIGGRGIASRPQMATSWEKRSFENLATDQASIQKVGQRPSQLDQLALGRLQGNYGIEIHSGKITQLRLNPDRKASVLPNPVAFLKRHRKLFGPEVQSVRQVFADENTTGSLKRFELLSEEGQAIGVVTLTLDSEQGLLSASIQ